MAKDGTNRGGARVGAGRKSKALVDKINAGTSAQILELPEPPVFEGEDVPPVKEYLKAKQKMGKDLFAECISEYGFLAKHPTTGNAIASPYVAMSQTYMKQVNQIWYQIFQVVKENCSVEWQGGTPQDDVMERLLRTRRGM